MLVDIIAIVFGIWLSVRRMDVRVRQPEQYPEVDAEAFGAWQRRAALAYNLGALACFGEIVLDHGFEYLGRRAGLSFRPLQAGHALIFFGWIAAMGWVWVQARRASKVQEALGIAGPPRRGDPPAAG